MIGSILKRIKRWNKRRELKDMLQNAHLQKTLALGSNRTFRLQLLDKLIEKLEQELKELQ